MGPRELAGTTSTPEEEEGEPRRAPLSYWQAEMLASSATRLADRRLTTRRQCPQQTALPRGGLLRPARGRQLQPPARPIAQYMGYS